MKIALIGGAGYIGTRLAQHLTSKHEVSIIDPRADYYHFNLGMVHQDNYDHFSSWYFDSNIDCIIFLGGYSSVASAMNGSPANVFKKNVISVIDLFNRTKTPIIYASSAGVYGNSLNNIWKEDFTEFHPLQIYDLTKWTVDLYTILTKRPHTFGLRFGSVNGFSPVLRTDVMLNKMAYTAHKNNKIFIANPFRFRPILGLTDLCNGIEAVLNKLDLFGGIYNLSSGNWDVSELARTASTVFNTPIEHLPDEVGYDMRVDTRKFEHEFKWSPQMTPLKICEELRENWHDIRSFVERR